MVILNIELGKNKIQILTVKNVYNLVNIHNVVQLLKYNLITSLFTKLNYQKTVHLS